MATIDYKEKYEKAVQAAMLAKQDTESAVTIGILEEIFPELRESEDQRIRKEIIAFLTYYHTGQGNSVKYDDNWIAWLEKQGENCLVNFDEAEKEKYDFVSGQFIECRKSFNGFKEENSYWLEYVGDDNYIGRSDNILNQKFHITPRQLFTLFTWQHRPKENNVNEETNAPTGYGKYVDECLNEASKHFFSEGEDKYSVVDLFYAGVRCGKSWFEKQGEQPRYSIGDVLCDKLCTTLNKDAQPNFEIIDIRNGMYICDKGSFPISQQDEYELVAKKIEQKYADKVEPKFKKGDWVVNKGHSYLIADIDFLDNRYLFEIGGYTHEQLNWEYIENVDNKYHLWTIEDAKDGDVLIDKSGSRECPFIFKETKPSDIKTDILNPLAVLGYCGIGGAGFTKGSGWGDTANCIYYPATKEQRDILFEKMKEAGYEWDTDKKDSK